MTIEMMLHFGIMDCNQFGAAFDRLAEIDDACDSGAGRRSGRVARCLPRPDRVGRVAMASMGFALAGTRPGWTLDPSFQGWTYPKNGVFTQENGHDEERSLSTNGGRSCVTTRLASPMGSGWFATTTRRSGRALCQRRSWAGRIASGRIASAVCCSATSPRRGSGHSASGSTDYPCLFYVLEGEVYPPRWRVEAGRSAAGILRVHGRRPQRPHPQVPGDPAVTYLCMFDPDGGPIREECMVEVEADDPQGGRAVRHPARRRGREGGPRRRRRPRVDPPPERATEALPRPRHHRPRERGHARRTRGRLSQKRRFYRIESSHPSGWLFSLEGR